MPKSKKIEIGRATATLIESRLVNKTTIYTKQCPWGINYVDEENELEHIRRVGHENCYSCEYFVGIKDAQVYCKDK